MRLGFLTFLVVSAIGVACSKSEDPAAGSSGDRDAAADAAPLQTTFGGSRPVELRVPEGYDPKKPAPLLLMLHGYGSGGVLNDAYMKMTSIADAKGFFYVSPDGTIDSSGKHFWNATDLCCNFDGSTVDDVAYLTSLVAEIRGVYAIDPKRIFVMGHSNGGFMANRLACDHAETFAAAVSWAGGNFGDPSRCKPTEPLAYLQIHGTKDSAVPFEPSAGGGGEMPFPGAAGTVAIWAQRNGCETPLTDAGESLRVSGDSKADDTKVARWGKCRANGAAELWPVEGADHLFAFTPDAVNAVWRFMESHPKP